MVVPGRRRQGHRGFVISRISLLVNRLRRQGRAICRSSVAGIFIDCSCRNMVASFACVADCFPASARRLESRWRGEWRGGSKRKCGISWLTDHEFTGASISYRSTSKAIFRIRFMVVRQQSVGCGRTPASTVTASTGSSSPAAAQAVSWRL